MRKKKETSEVIFTEQTETETSPVYPVLRVDPEEESAQPSKPAPRKRSPRPARAPRRKAEAVQEPVEEIPAIPVEAVEPAPEKVVEEVPSVSMREIAPVIERPSERSSERPSEKHTERPTERPSSRYPEKHEKIEEARSEQPVGQPTPAASQVPPASAAPPASQRPQIETPTDLEPAVLEHLPEMVRKAAERGKWTRLMPVQAQAIPYILARRDLMVQSRTGSGKTGAFLLPMFDRIDPNKAACQALILIPTRELAVQVAAQAEVLTADSGIRSVAVYGGVGYSAQMEAFRKGAHIVIGTPGRVLDHLLKRSLSLDSLRMLVFDEADRMLSMGFYPDMKQVKRYLPDRPMNGYMFSATYPPHVMRLAGEFLRNPEFLSLSRDHVHVAETEHICYNVPAMDKDRALIRIIEMENPESAIIFCNTKAKVHYVTVVLQRFGYDADELSADLSQADREQVLKRVREGSLRFLVATDVAARGIDIPFLSHVFLYEPPEDPESYIHRAGRTGRAGAPGEAVSLVAGMELVELQRIARRFHIELQKRSLPTDEDVEKVVGERIVALLEAHLRSRDRLQTERARRFIPLARSLAESEEELSAIAMLLDDYYHETLHAPPVPPEEVKKLEETKKEDGEPGRERDGQHRRNRRWRRR